MSDNHQRFTEQWDAIDPFDPNYPHLWIKVEHLGRYLFAAAYCAEQKARTIADIGCGTGYGAQELAAVAPSIIGIDAAPPLVDRVNALMDARISAVCAELGVDPLTLILPDNRFDGIVCFETLEHLTDPAAALREFRDALVPGGKLILSVPNSVSERIDPVGLLTNPFHKRLFSISSISELVIAAGFQITHVLGQPIASEINRNETRLIRRKQTSGRIGDAPSFHEAESIRRLALTMGYPEQRDVERSYSIIIVATRDQVTPEQSR